MAALSGLNVLCTGAAVNSVLNSSIKNTRPEAHQQQPTTKSGEKQVGANPTAVRPACYSLNEGSRKEASDRPERARTPHPPGSSYKEHHVHLSTTDPGKGIAFLVPRALRAREWLVQSGP